MIELKIYDKENTHTRVQRNSVLVEDTNGMPPIGKVVNPCRWTWIAKKKTFTNIFLCLNKKSFSVLSSKIATQQAH